MEWNTAAVLSIIRITLHLGLIKRRSHVIDTLRTFLLSDTNNPPQVPYAYSTSLLSLCDNNNNSLGI